MAVVRRRCASHAFGRRIAGYLPHDAVSGVAAPDPAYSSALIRLSAVGSRRRPG